MDKVTALAEEILMNAARDNGGHCYPSQLPNNCKELDEALKKLEIYGRVFVITDGPMPIFTINETGRTFAALGAWSEKERKESFFLEQDRVAAARHKESIELAKKNNRFQMIAIVVAILVCIFSLLFQCSR